jgi:phosphoribosylamine--glycine ligase
MNILLLGSGAREHALAWKISSSPLTSKLFIAPGNAGTNQVGINIPLNPLDFDAIKAFVLQNSVELVIVGPEEPLVRGIYDHFKNDRALAEIPIVGPSKHGAMLEGSKDFAKEFMIRNNIPTAKYQTFSTYQVEEAKMFLETMSPPYVLKADGLAAGKGVIIVESKEEAYKHLDEMLTGKSFGTASEKVVIEQFLKGIELSVFVITDGDTFILLPEAKDYKRIGAGDTGLNTGGMGSISPVPFADKEFMQKVVERIIKPTVSGLKEEQIDYKGFIFFGLINVGGDPYVIEYNVRMGDPETESVIPRIKSDLVPVLIASTNGTLSSHDLIFDERAAATVMLVSGGYPGNYEKGITISGLENSSNSLIFHAGTSTETESGKTVTSGGRVLAITSLASKASDALNQSYSIAEKVNFKGKYYREDLGFDILK